MQKLKPDAAMLGPRRTVWFDAKYKPHLAELQRRGWFGASNALQSEHRADLHQALAYAACGSTDVIDAVLVYPSLSSEPRALGLSHAEVGRGARRSRIILGALPFGFSGPDQREQALNDWQMALRES
jgi:5-methylcytosine-specific restriction endonuclease McrBC regulatory subunit McrC